MSSSFNQTNSNLFDATETSYYSQINSTIINSYSVNKFDMNY